MAAGELGQYRRKRDLGASPEPSGGVPSAGEPRFVIHKHDATSLHYDVRLEVGGVMKSWAVPKGPSFDPADRRLAMPTPDHPMSYNDFEGVLPEGTYGAGPVIVWDRGTYRNLAEEPMEDGLAAGRLKVWLEGHKLVGGWSLRRVRIGSSDREKWLLAKLKDETADPGRDVVASEPASVVSGRTIEGLTAAG